MPKSRVGLFLSIVVAPEGGKGQRVDLTHKVLGFSFADAEHKADKLTLQVDNWNLENFDDPVWRKGGFITATWGYADAKQSVTCVIQSVKGAQVLAVEALAKSILLHKEKRPRVFKGKKRSDVAQQIAEEWDYQGASLVHIEDTQQVYETIAQGGRTDAQLLAQMAKQEGFVFCIDSSGFHFHRRNLGQPPIRALHWYSDPEAGDVLSIDIENDVTAVAGSVAVAGRNPMTRKDFKVKADNDSTKREGLAPQPETQKQGYELSGITAEFSVKRLVTHEEHHASAHTEAAARRVAEGNFGTGQLGTVKLKASIIGDPNLKAKSIIEWRGLGKRLSGKYYVKTVTHKIDASGYLCDLECRRDGHSERGTPESKAQVNTKKAVEEEAAAGGTRGIIDYKDGRAYQTFHPTQGATAPGGPNDKPQGGGH